MGNGMYSHEAHAALTNARARAPREEVFRQSSCHPLMNPHGVRLRECRDSVDHPNSLGIAFALDVTGSMGDIPEQLARQELPKFMKALTQCGVVDPQVMFVAVGDANSDNAPLQVGQFESTAELMDKWLTSSFIERGGGGSGEESYELALYFLAEHTAMDCWEKRHKRGYAFLTGDELSYNSVARGHLERIFGDRADEDIPTDAVVAAVQVSFEPFFLIPDLARAQRCERHWRDLLGDHVIVMEDASDTCIVAAGAVALGEGLVKDIAALGPVLLSAGASPERLPAVMRALTPYAASLRRDGAPDPKPPKAHPGPNPGDGGGSWWKRLLGT